ncbi:hypothetical protein M427DRAFT_234639 [Gonapodya prolifera JEL478]|uniref:Uncharacterized protein n=1 Tax=Gonapodya prolifera (strain JEL478) TaxID=1344416 RepID=A0A139AM97_GONPJ|nr:hypothetical protein M427DRAFT_234639 [Gonapodya prolifera JEL478]|eukprot:KXS17879.1 hypothetical protein M427DRAFT_234639 [Gonapodya prolifera JEL478]
MLYPVAHKKTPRTLYTCACHKCPPRLLSCKSPSLTHSENLILLVGSLRVCRFPPSSEFRVPSSECRVPSAECQVPRGRIIVRRIGCVGCVEKESFAVGDTA